MTQDNLIEAAALRMANFDARRLDVPELASIEEFRLESTYDGYVARATDLLPLLQGEWRDIDSAPRDGTWIIVVNDLGTPFRVSWGVNHNGDLAWCTSSGFVSGYRVMTWMPAPPPADKEEK